MKNTNKGEQRDGGEKRGNVARNPVTVTRSDVRANPLDLKSSSTGLTSDVRGGRGDGDPRAGSGVNIVNTLGGKGKGGGAINNEGRGEKGRGTRSKEVKDGVAAVPLPSTNRVDINKKPKAIVTESSAGKKKGRGGGGGGGGNRNAPAITQDDMVDYSHFDSDDSDLNEQWRDFSEGVLEDDSQFLSKQRTPGSGGGRGRGGRKPRARVPAAEQKN